MLKFSIGREDLLKPLEQVSGPACASPQGDKITLNVLLRVKKVDEASRLKNSSLKDAEFMLQMICTDTEIEMISEVGVFSDVIELGETTVNVKTLVDIIKTLPDATYVNFYLDANNLVLQTENNNFALSTKPAEQFPSIESLDTVYELSIKHKELLTVMKTTAFSIAEDNYRYFLKGMRFEISGSTLNIFAADGHRLSMQKGKLESEVILPDSCEDNGFIFPRKGVMELIKLLEIQKDSEDIIKLSLSKNSLKTSVGGISLVCKLIEAAYPVVTNVVPKNCTRIIIVDRDYFLKTIRRVSILSNSKNNGIEFVVKGGELTIKARNSQHEEAKEKVNILYQGDDFEMAYNSSYFLDICKVISTQKIKISMSQDSNNAMLEAVADSEKDEPSFARYIVSRVVL